MWLVQPRCDRPCDKKLRVVSILPTVGHRQHSHRTMWMNKIFIFKCISVNALTAGPVPIGYITPLYHKIGDYSVKAVPAVMKVFSAFSLSFLPGTEAFKVFRCKRRVTKQLKLQAAHIKTINGYIKEHPIRTRRLYRDSMFWVVVLPLVVYCSSELWSLLSVRDDLLRKFYWDIHGLLLILSCRFLRISMGH